MSSSLVQALRQSGWTPGVISRGHGRSSHAAVEVRDDSPVAGVGDEPLLLIVGIALARSVLHSG